MNTLTDELQIIKDDQGQPAFVVIPYAAYMAAQRCPSPASHTLIPHDVVSRTVNGATPMRAWREHLKLTQAEVAQRMGISQSAYAQQERSKRLRVRSRQKIALALGLDPQQLSF